MWELEHKESCCCCCYIASVVCDSVWPQRRQPTRLPCPWDSPGKNTGVGCYFLLHESWTIKKAECWRTDAFELWCWRRLLRVPWTARRSNQSILKDQSWVFIGMTYIEAETPIFWPPDAKSWLIWKDPDAGKDWGQEETGTTEDEMVGWHHRLKGREFG